MKKITDVFREDQIILLNNVINNTTLKQDKILGRKVGELNLPDDIKGFINNIVRETYSKSLSLGAISYAEYNNKYGNPNLPPHFDGDDTDIIFNFQLESNTSWDLGLDLELYSIENNSALLFNPNKSIHWRPIKQFDDGEYVKMIFFRFRNSDKSSDYSNLRYSLDHEIFNQVNKLRDSVNNK